MTILTISTKQLQKHVAWLDITHLVIKNPSSNIAMLKPSQQFIKTLNCLTHLSSYIAQVPSAEKNYQKSLDQGIEIIIAMLKNNPHLNQFLIASLETSSLTPYLKIKLNKVALRHFHPSMS